LYDHQGSFFRAIDDYSRENRQRKDLPAAGAAGRDSENKRKHRMDQVMKTINAKEQLITPMFICRLKISRVVLSGDWRSLMWRNGRGSRTRRSETTFSSVLPIDREGTATYCTRAPFNRIWTCFPVEIWPGSASGVSISVADRNRELPWLELSTATLMLFSWYAFTRICTNADASAFHIKNSFTCCWDLLAGWSTVGTGSSRRSTDFRPCRKEASAEKRPNSDHGYSQIRAVICCPSGIRIFFDDILSYLLEINIIICV